MWAHPAIRGLIGGLLVLIWLVSSTPVNAHAATRFVLPSSAEQLIVVSSPGYDPPRHLATFRAYERVRADTPWHLAFGPWTAEIGLGDLRDHRHEGDGSTPTGVYGLGGRIYGNRRNPGGLHLSYHRLVCGDWWDEDPYSSDYNRFMHVPCGVRPTFAGHSEALWTEPTAYPYFAVVRFNADPVRGGLGAPGSAIFLHGWVNGPTAGCVALSRPRLLSVLRWLRPSARPVIEIGTDAEVGAIPSR